MGVPDISSRGAVERAIAECDELGETTFLEKYGYGRSRKVYLYVDGKPYPAKAILGAAHGYEFPDRGPLPSAAFTSGESMERKLWDLGFETRVTTGDETHASEGDVVAVFVGQQAQTNFAVARDEKLWGWAEPQRELAGLPLSSLFVFGSGFSGGSPRVQPQAWSAGRLERIVIARTTSEPYTDATPVWPNENAEVSYPHRIGLEFIDEITGVDLGSNDLSDQVVDALRRSATGGRANRISNDASPLLEPFRSSPRGADAVISSSLAEIADEFRLAVEQSGLAIPSGYGDRVNALLAAIVTKPLVILSGLSGSGKTQLAQKLGEWFGVGAVARYLSVAVRPDWSGPEALLGYEDALRPAVDGRAVWFAPDTLRFVLQAASDPHYPYLLLLDEMNLAHVERYFADLLSGMESRDPVIPNLVESASGQWQLAEVGPEKIPLPRNLVIAGTVNVDETTYLFSPKVLDRASTFEIRTRTDELVVGARRPQRAQPGSTAGLRGLAKLMGDDDWHVTAPSLHQQKLADALRRLHEYLVISGDEFGHRTFYDSMRLAAAYRALDDDQFAQTLDLIVLLKILPKVHGARRRVEPVLERLQQFATAPADVPSRDDSPRLPLTHAKVTRMIDAVRINQFVSFTE